MKSGLKDVDIIIMLRLQLERMSGSLFHLLENTLGFMDWIEKSLILQNLMR